MKVQFCEYPKLLAALPGNIAPSNSGWAVRAVHSNSASSGFKELGCPVSVAQTDRYYAMHTIDRQPLQAEINFKSKLMKGGGGGGFCR